jgi:hypothetical protein
MQMAAEKEETCCPPFDPGPWDEKEIVWQNKKFLQDRVRSFLHIPLNFGAVMRRDMTKIMAAGALTEPTVLLSDEASPWGANVFIDVAKDVPGSKMTTISGKFLSKVFEGPYKNIRTWIGQMHGFVKSRGKEVTKLYFYYTTCPKCAKKYGKNYVVLLAQI